MDKYTEYLLDRIFEIREDYNSGDLGSKDYYENVVSELISSLSHYTINIVDKGYTAQCIQIINWDTVMYCVFFLLIYIDFNF